MHSPQLERRSHLLIVWPTTRFNIHRWGFFVTLFINHPQNLTAIITSNNNKKKLCPDTKYSTMTFKYSQTWPHPGVYQSLFYCLLSYIWPRRCRDKWRLEPVLEELPDIGPFHLADNKCLTQYAAVHESLQVHSKSIYNQRNLLFGRIKCGRLHDLRGDLLRGPLLLLLGQRLFRNDPLLLRVVQDQRAVLPLDLRAQTVLVVVPEQVQQLIQCDDRRIKVDFDHLRVVATVGNTKGVQDEISSMQPNIKSGCTYMFLYVGLGVVPAAYPTRVLSTPRVPP